MANPHPRIAIANARLRSESGRLDATTWLVLGSLALIAVPVANWIQNRGIAAEEIFSGEIGRAHV